MRNKRNYRPPFDPSPTCQFVYMKALRVGGVPVAIGDPVDREMLDTRRLRQMYDGRIVAYAPGSAPPEPSRRPQAVGPTDLHHPDKAQDPEKAKKRGVARRAA